MGDKQFTQRSSAKRKVLRKLKEAAESYGRHRVNRAVITVRPVSMTLNVNHQRRGSITGRCSYHQRQTAAVIPGLDKQRDHKIAVFDLGGGTFDVYVKFTADQRLATIKAKSSKLFQQAVTLT
ncbi:MAG: Hsp70 family protein [Pirellulales bacterium]